MDQRTSAWNQTLFMTPIVLTHLFTFFRALGGVESILRRHWRNDVSLGFESQILAYFETTESLPERVDGLGLSWRDTIRSTRRKFRRKLTETHSEVGIAVYHNSWGLPFLADLDGATRRVAMLHSDLPVLSRLLNSQRGLVDGVLCVSEPLRSSTLAAHPELDPHRVAVAPYPILTPPGLVPQKALAGRPIVFGFAGRIVREQKRIERLPEVCRSLRAAGIDFRFEILGDGPDRAWLEEQFVAEANVVFHRRKEGAEYWRILSSWDAILFVSDYEGLPIALLEALSAGVIPIFPKIGSGGDTYAAAVRPDLLYADRAEIPNLIHQISAASVDEIESLRQRCKRITAPHQGDAYERAFAHFIRQIAAEPRVSAPAPSRPFFFSDFCPFGILRRVYYQGHFNCGLRIANGGPANPNGP